ncbi:MAG TPA: 3-deoxy-8-phosphooctulonate synthase, partial [Pseudobdellovibrionaceae bacterium]|nr:3-deoxy-8-phosphooctulonate synthase [Pseudobdellovibrionaceae bacterium]
MTGFKALAKTVTLKTSNQTITWGDAKNFVLFAGPDIIEDEGLVKETAQELKRVTQKLEIPWILKCSFDKANRQSSSSFRGPGMSTALKSLDRIKSEFDVPLLTDIHETNQVEDTAKVADVLQIPAFLSRQTDLMVA